MPSTQDVIDTFLKGLGLSAAQRAGVEGNLLVESNFNPAAYNPREGAIGIAQWEGGRRTRLQQMAAQAGKPETDLNLQLNYLGWELQGPEHNALVKLQQANSASAAAAAFDQYYERSSGAARGKREQAAEAIYAGNPLNAATDPAGYAANAGSLGAAGAGSLLSGWGADALKIGLYVVGALAAGGLVILGAKQAVDDKDN